MTVYDISDTHVEKHFVSTMYACYADIIFIVLPFLLTGLLRLWNGEGFNILKHPDISIATAILAGMSLGKLILALVSNKNLTRYKVRFVFFIALILFFIIGPTLIFIISAIDGKNIPEAAIFLQPILLLATIILYSISFNITYFMTTVVSKTPKTDEHI